MDVKFTIDGEPRGKGRPRFTKTGRAYTPTATREYETRLKIEYERQSGVRFPDDAAIGLEIIAYFGIPKSDSKKKHADKASGKIRPKKRPDMDNIIKSVADSLNGVAYRDDAQIVTCKIDKYFSETPRVEVRIYVKEGEP